VLLKKLLSTVSSQNSFLYLLYVLWYLNRTLLCRYVHSYQSYLWNHAASMRVEKYGESTCAPGSAVVIQAAVLKLYFGILSYALVLSLYASNG
jgi:tRNA(Glu) U13 pseudouridine synthase TruD